MFGFGSHRKKDVSPQRPEKPQTAPAPANAKGVEERLGTDDIPALSLAYLGDGVYELLLREKLIKLSAARPGELHERGVAMARASTQAKACALIEPLLTKSEAEALRRGRNARSSHTPQGCTVSEYRHATALEALFGSLYLHGSAERCRELFDVIFNELCEAPGHGAEG